MTGQMICGLCGDCFGGRSDAIYCSSACRQKAHRGRTARRVTALAEQQRSPPHRRRTVIEPNVAFTIERARSEQRRARELCLAAADMQRRALMSQWRSASRESALAASAMTSPHWSGWAAIDRDTGSRM